MDLLSTPFQFFKLQDGVVEGSTEDKLHFTCHSVNMAIDSEEGTR